MVQTDVRQSKKRYKASDRSIGLRMGTNDSTINGKGKTDGGLAGSSDSRDIKPRLVIQGLEEGESFCGAFLPAEKFRSQERFLCFVFSQLIIAP